MARDGASGGYQPIEELDFFRDLEMLSDAVWHEVSSWQPHARDSLGIQLVRSMDSIGANLAEGDARYSDRDSLRFFDIARASAREARLWLDRARRRGLISQPGAAGYLESLASAMRRLGTLMTTRRQRLSTAREDRGEYFPFGEPDANT